MKKFFSILLASAMMLVAANANADWVADNEMPVGGYKLEFSTYWQNPLKGDEFKDEFKNKWQNVIDAVFLTAEPYIFEGECLGVKLTLHLANLNISEGQNGVKFDETTGKGSFIHPEGFFSSESYLPWTASQGNDKITSNRESYLYFNGDNDWGDFKEILFNGSFEVAAHLQSLNSSVAGVGSINLATFSWDGNKETYNPSVEENLAGTPEPATMLILGLGALGAGVCGRRFRKN